MCGLWWYVLYVPRRGRLWKIYISIGGEGCMVWTQTCQQIDKVTSLFSCSWTHTENPHPPKHLNIQNKPKIKVATLSSIHYRKATQNHWGFMIFHHLAFYFLPQNLFFASLEGFVVLLAGRSIVSVWKEQTRSSQLGVGTLQSALWLRIEDI